MRTINELVILRNLGDAPIERNGLKITKVRGDLPPPWTKENIDDTSRRNPGNTGYGSFFRNSRGFSKGCFSMPIWNEMTFIAEARVFMKMMELVILKGWFPLWVETDSKLLYDKVNEKNLEVPWQIKAEWKRCMKTLEECSSLLLVYIGKVNVL